MNKITKQIKKAMKHQGITPWQLEKITGINHSAIQRMLDGTDLRCDTAAKIMDVLGLDVQSRGAK